MGRGGQATMGRKVVPMNEKIAKGTYRKCRDKVAPDLSTTSKPIPPTWLNTRAKQIFHLIVKRLSDIKKDSSTHTEVIAELACQMEERQRLDQFLNENGLTETLYDTDKDGNKFVFAIRKRPEVIIRTEAAKRVHMLLQDLCLTPSTIHRAGEIKKDGGKKNEFADF